MHPAEILKGTASALGRALHVESTASDGEGSRLIGEDLFTFQNGEGY